MNHIKMKRKYIVPETLVVSVNCESMLLEGSKFDSGSDGNQLVKENEISYPEAPSYNVWDDDWRE